MNIQPSTTEALETRIAVYSERIAQLRKQAPNETLAMERLLEIVQVRDEIAREVALLPRMPQAIVDQLVREDANLRALGDGLDVSRASSLWRQWRDVWLPPENAWWWRLDVTTGGHQISVAATPLPISQVNNVLMLLLAGYFVSLSAAYSVDISKRFFSVGPDHFAIAGTAFQVLMTFVAGSVFVDSGRSWLRAFFDRSAVRSRTRVLFCLLLAATSLILTLCFRYYGLRTLASVYHARGNAAINHDLAAAIENYQRAVALAPDYAEGHYDLANAYELLVDYDNAIAAYRRALEIRPHFDQALSDLARLMIIKEKDYDRALQMMSSAEPLESKPQGVRFSISKNRGWALWRLNRAKEAEFHLRKATLLNPKDAESQFLLMEVLLAQNKLQDARVAWKSYQKGVRYSYFPWTWYELSRLGMPDSGAP